MQGVAEVTSPQQLVDCSSYTGNNGCGGGWYWWAWDYLKTHTANTEASYPYKAVDGSCKYVESNGNITVNTYAAITSKSTSALLSALDSYPLSVAIQADQYFQTYSSGVLMNNHCGTRIDHAVVAVGYGTTSTGVQYIIVQNSWGTSWGNNGFIWLEALASSRSGTCGINEYPYVVTPNP